MSSAHTADILDFNSKNSYMSWHFPYFIKDENEHSYPGRIIAEGYGKRIEAFKEALDVLKIETFFVSPEEKLMYIAALSISKDLPLMLEYTSKRLIKYALGSYSDLSQELMEMTKTSPETFNSYDPVEKDDADFAARQLDILQKLGIDEITRLYSSLLAISAQTKDTPTKESQRIALLSKKQ